MKDHKKLIEKFDFVLDNSAKDEHIQIAHQEINGDDKVLAEFKEHKILVDGIRYASRKKLLESIKTWDAEMTSIPKNRQFFMQKRWFLAAASIIIIFTFIAILSYFIRPEHEKLIANYYQPYSYGTDITRGDTAADGNDFFEAYQNGEYQKVIELYNSVGNSSDPVMTDFLYANSCQALKMYDSAIPVLERISRMDNPLAPAAKWYLAISFISEDDSDKAALVLHELTEMKSSYAAKAESLLRELEK